MFVPAFSFKLTAVAPVVVWNIFRANCSDVSMYEASYFSWFTANTSPEENKSPVTNAVDGLARLTFAPRRGA